MATMKRICRVECDEEKKVPATMLIIIDGSTYPSCDACVKWTQDALKAARFEALT